MGFAFLRPAKNDQYRPIISNYYLRLFSVKVGFCSYLCVIMHTLLSYLIIFNFLCSNKLNVVSATSCRRDKSTVFAPYGRNMKKNSHRVASVTLQALSTHSGQWPHRAPCSPPSPWRLYQRRLRSGAVSIALSSYPIKKFREQI